MKSLMTAALYAVALTLTVVSTASAQTEYTRIRMDIDVNRSAEAVWDRVGGYCDISEWLGIDCEITSGDGGMGTVRVLAGGRITEIMVARTELAYGYTQPAVPGEFYDHYHGFMEARPVGDNRSRLIYTLVLDQSNLENDEARQADIERRRSTFERALANMKELAEAD